MTIRALRVAALGVLVSLGTTLATGSGAPGAAAAQGVLSTVTTAVSAPANAATAPDASLAATACVPADGCLSVGTYVTSALRVEPMAAPSAPPVLGHRQRGVQRERRDEGREPVARGRLHDQQGSHHRLRRGL